MTIKVAHSWWLRAVYLGLAGLTLASCGCLAVAAGATGGAALGYCYYKGEMFQKYQASVPDTFAAAHTALADLRMPVLKEELKDGTAYLESRTTDGDKVHIKLSTQKSKIPAEGTYALVGVRVGWFGSDAVSEQILAQIGAHLTMPMMPPATVLGPIRPVSAAGAPPPPPQPLAAEPPLAAK